MSDESVGALNLMILVSIPIVCVCVIFLVGFFVYHHFRRLRPHIHVDPEPNLETNPLVPCQNQTIREICDSHSGSGSGSFTYIFYCILTFVHLSFQPVGARCSSVVRAFARGAMGRQIDPSWSGPIELFLVPASANPL